MGWTPRRFFRPDLFREGIDQVYHFVVGNCVFGIDPHIAPAVSEKRRRRVLVRLIRPVENGLENYAAAPSIDNSRSIGVDVKLSTWIRTVFFAAFSSFTMALVQLSPGVKKTSTLAGVGAAAAGAVRSNTAGKNLFSSLGVDCTGQWAGYPAPDFGRLDA